MIINGQNWVVLKEYPKFILCTNGIYRECFNCVDLGTIKNERKKPDGWRNS